MVPDPLAVRVARRHQAALVVRDIQTTKTRIEYWASGGISAVELANMLEPEFGCVMRLRFRSTRTVPTTSVTWEAVTEGGNVVTGTLVFHPAVFEDEVVSWAVATVNLTPGSAASTPNC